MISPVFPEPVVRRHGVWRPVAGMPPCQARLIIGYGNDLRSDDGAGARAATMIAARLSKSQNSRVIVSRQLTHDLAGDIATAAQVVFIDAYAARQRSAKLRVERIFADDAASMASALVHHDHPVRLLGLAQRLYGCAPDAWMLGIPAFCFDVGETISPATRCRIDEAVAWFGE